MNLNGKWMRAAILALIAAAPFAVRAQSASEVGQAQSDTKPVREQWGPVVGQQLPPEGIFNPATGMRFIQLANGWVVEVPPEGRGLMPSTEAPEVTQTWEKCRRDHTIILAGKFSGSGTFVFEGSEISYRRESGEYPIMTVNARNWGIGIPLSPFRLPFQIEPGEFELKQTQGDNPVKLTKTGRNRFEVHFDAPEVPAGSDPAPYSITITPTNLPETNPPRITVAQARPQSNSARTGANPAQDTATNEPASSKELTITLKGIFDGRGVFTFEGNKVTYRHWLYDRPTQVSINGVPWNDLNVPFVLDFTPDFEKAVIIDKIGRDQVELTPGKTKFELMINDESPSVFRYQVVIAAKDQTSHSKYLRNDPISLTLKGVFGGRGTFVFEGNTIVYRHEGGKEPTGVTVDDEPWKDLAKPFELEFTPDFEDAVIEDQSRQISMRRVDARLIPDKDKFELNVNSLGTAEYSVTIAAKNRKRTGPAQRVSGNARIQPSPVSGPTDGQDHPRYPVTRPVVAQPSIDRGAKIEIKGMVDRKAAFRFGGANLVYQNYATDPSKPAGSEPELFDGKFAWEVTVNGGIWPNLSAPFNNPTGQPGKKSGLPVDPSKDTHLIVKPCDCDIALTEHNGVLEVVVTNRTAEPAPFHFILKNGETGDDRARALFPYGGGAPAGGMGGGN